MAKDADIPRTKVKSSHDVLGEQSGFKKEVAPASTASKTDRKRKEVESENDSGEDDGNDEKYNKKMKEKLASKQRKTEDTTKEYDFSPFSILLKLVSLYTDLFKIKSNDFKAKSSRSEPLKRKKRSLFNAKRGQ